MKNLAPAPMKLLLIVFFAFALNASKALAAEEKIVVVVESVLEVAQYLKKIGFYNIDNHPERLQAVPRTRILRVHKTVEDVWRKNVSLRKSVFYRLGLSAALQVNEEIIVQRERLRSLSLDNLSAGDGAWMSAMMARYGVAKAGDPPTVKRLAELIHRVDALPPSLIMAQGAIESGWAKSRFARKGQAMFGQRTTSKSGLKALDSEARVAAFETPRQSLIAYMLNLNSQPAYNSLRKARAEMRHNGQPLDGYALAGHLDKYAETGEEYVQLVRRMIQRDDLTRGDTAKLAPGPRILFRHVDHK